MINCLYIEGNGRCSNENSVCYQGKCEFEEGCEVCTTHRAYKFFNIPIDGPEVISVKEMNDVIQQGKEETIRQMRQIMIDGCREDEGQRKQKGERR